jgi:VIT1/CCC1 family predicted Fe2+/Mn2+ transporter
MRRDDLTQAIMGGADGLISALGAVVVLAAKGDFKALVVASVAYAVGSAGSMAGSEWLSDVSQSARRALVMGAATLCGSIAPAVPFFVLRGPLAWLCAAAVTVTFGSLIAEVRPEAPLPSYLHTFGVLTVASGLAVLTSVLAGAVA